MTTITLKDQLRKLIELQEIDAQAFEYKRVMKEKPAEIEVLRLEFEAKKVTLKQIEDKLKTIQVKQKEFELELKEHEGGIAKAEGSLSLLKTNKEYQARLLEIENLKADKSLVEEKILLGFDEVDAARKEAEAEKKIVATYEQDYLSRKKLVDDEIAIAKDQLTVKESQRKQITPDVRPDVLGRYERILNNKDGVGIAPIKDHACGGCYMHVTEQLEQEVRKYAQLIICDACARILYLPDEI